MRRSSAANRSSRPTTTADAQVGTVQILESCSIAHGINKLNCTMHGSRHPCVRGTFQRVHAAQDRTISQNLHTTGAGPPVCLVACLPSTRTRRARCGPTAVPNCRPHRTQGDPPALPCTNTAPCHALGRGADSVCSAVAGGWTEDFEQRRMQEEGDLSLLFAQLLGPANPFCLI